MGAYSVDFVTCRSVPISFLGKLFVDLGVLYFRIARGQGAGIGSFVGSGVDTAEILPFSWTFVLELWRVSRGVMFQLFGQILYLLDKQGNLVPQLVVG